ncbi:hypothetical protein TcCL_ESM11824 [Trypanosoma cruzi]|nr:hypothetical protein TcCL_ESM11824 [Trypanosoma cruzi]
MHSEFVIRRGKRSGPHWRACQCQVLRACHDVVPGPHASQSALVRDSTLSALHRLQQTPYEWRVLWYHSRAQGGPRKQTEYMHPIWAEFSHLRNARLALFELNIWMWVCGA